MRYLLAGILLLLLQIYADASAAWDGFDAASADLVEIIPDSVPAPGETISVKNHDLDRTDTCLVESIKRNKRTIEIVVMYPDNSLHTLVMEGR